MLSACEAGSLDFCSWKHAPFSTTITLAFWLQVMFIDFGNRDQVAGNQVRAIDPSLAAVPAQAHPCKLAYLKVGWVAQAPFERHAPSWQLASILRLTPAN